jgi:hypothetical protein
MLTLSWIADAILGLGRSMSFSLARRTATMMAEVMTSVETHLEPVA